MRIGGYQKTSLIDYPGKVAAVIFTSGCNFRCPYCHNRDLVLARPEDGFFEVSEVLKDLEERKNLIEGVCITGGEPTLQKDLLEFIKKIKGLGLLVKLDTNGSNASALCSAVVNGLVDFVALDVKAPLDHRYARSVGLEKFDVFFILSSMKELISSGIDFELRTTVVPTLHSEKDLLDLAKQLSEIAPKAKWVLQNFRPKNCLDPEFEKIKPYDKIFLGNLVEKLRVHMPNIKLRE